MRLGIAGVGRIGAFHATTLTGVESVDELLIADADPLRAGEVAARLGATAAGSVEALLTSGAAGRIDGLVVAAATSAHAELVAAAVQAGIPVLCEKPVAEDLPAARGLLAAANEAGATVVIGFQRRFDTGFLAARAAVASGELGWLHTVRASTLDVAPPPAAYVAVSGGLFRDCAVHDIDSTRWVLGREVVSVYARGTNRGAAYFTEYDDVDSASALLTFDDGTVATLSATRYNSFGHDIRLELAGSRASVAVGLDERTPLRSL
ncbi:MAG: Gfo/Idh/MocA family protein, partial [Janthinobacterium lividum]